jgi:hypothetical protein
MHIIPVDKKSLNSIIELIEIPTFLDWNDVIRERMYNIQKIEYPIQPLTRNETQLHDLWNKHLLNINNVEQFIIFFDMIKEYHIELDFDHLFQYVFNPDVDIANTKQYITISGYLYNAINNVNAICQIIIDSTISNNIELTDYIINYYTNTGISIETLKDNLSIYNLLDYRDHHICKKFIDYLIDKKLLEPKWDEFLDEAVGTNNFSMVKYFVEIKGAKNLKLVLERALKEGYTSFKLKKYLFEKGNILVEAHMFTDVSKTLEANQYFYKEKLQLLSYMAERAQRMDN